MRRRTLLLVASALIPAAAFAATRPAHAAMHGAYTQAAFEAARTAGKPILIAVDASWCPTCAKQRPIVESLKAKPVFKDLVILSVDFDAQKDVLKALGVTKQSTLIAFRGAAERDRSTGVTDQAAIEALMMKSVS